jgi:uncharacterized protein (DUF58 family)
LSFPQALSLAALIAAGLILWNLRQWLLLLFAAIVLALALCSLVDAAATALPDASAHGTVSQPERTWTPSHRAHGGVGATVH